MLATNGQSLPGITTWQLTHPIPYEYGISEDVYHDLFDRVGRDESLQQGYFLERCAEIEGKPVLAYDSTTISTYSTNIPEARQGFNKAHDGLDTIKLLSLYSIETRQPVAFTKQPGNLPDIITIENALKQLKVLGLGDAEIITDNGYCSEKNMADLFLAHFDFLTLIKVGTRWVKKELDPKIEAESFQSGSSICPFDTGTHGITVMLMHSFNKTRRYKNHRSGAEKGTEEAFSRRIYLHLYFNQYRRVEESIRFDRDLLEIKRYIEEGLHAEELSDDAQNKISKYMHIHHYRDKVTVTFNEEAIAERKHYHGYFALVSNCEKDPFEALRKYRRRETIESFFESGKQRADMARVRVWNADCLRGRMFVQFIALCYYEYLNEQLRRLKEVLGRKNGDSDHDTKAVLDDEKKLLAWIKDKPLYLLLQWFDTVEETRVSTPILTSRWSTEHTLRDRMFLRKLGM